ncbi:MAG TPA: hypothetical protein DFR83_21130 [Deltaproteobacteria bacterium]|nr:hypothetical protein [Deltaproteobacteria bacterium]
MPQRPSMLAILHSSIFFSCTTSGDDKDEQWTTKGCPTPEFRAACNDLYEFNDADRELFESACEASMPGVKCADDEMCVDATCLPLYEDAQAGCTATSTPLETTLTYRISAVAQESCTADDGAETGASSVSIVRRGDGTLEAYYGSVGDAGISAACFPEELDGLAILATDCVPQPRSGWDDVVHNLALTFPDIDPILYTGDSAEFMIGTEKYTLTIGIAEETLLYGPLTEGDPEPTTRVEVLVTRDGYAPPEDAGQ